MATRTPLLGNDDVIVSVAAASEPMAYFYRNTGGDELLFIHRGSGAIETHFSSLAYREHDYVVIPTGTTYRVQPATPTRMLVYETTGQVKYPRRYRNEFGQLEEHAPYYERDFRAPLLQPPIESQGEYEVRVTNGGRNAVYVVQNHPCDVIGWDGYCYPYAFNLEEFAPSLVASPAPAGARDLRSAGRRVLRVRTEALRLPPARYSGAIQSLERRLRRSPLLRERQLHEPARRRGGLNHSARRGSAHGPQPGAVEQSLGKKSTDEIAVMIDTFKPLQLAEAALECEDPQYFRSWVEDRPAPKPARFAREPRRTRCGAPGLLHQAGAA